MGNCQAIDSASLLIQHPDGRSERFYTPVSVNRVVKLNPGHHVALLLTTTVYASAGNEPVRITRIKLMRPNETLILGHVYRLLTSQEVAKGLMARKQTKLKEKSTDFDETQRGRNKRKSKGWQPSLRSISEAGGS
ncbi:hypothetical protein M569_16059 [Genlisea aurea]|uniref:Uncharacterized protein n=1 Tax=Genlisea aurea TaxID=192259 RepID=S8BWK4_9LAMI|nr:hypothetical protein M569_16059 [Genlisea aurea]